ncbi:MAG TPA: pitrilysin family protein [Vicinamibacterales bacterium]|nr:pitrilysin family protein [Vicinamibacterales bacterium]
MRHQALVLLIALSALLPTGLSLRAAEEAGGIPELKFEKYRLDNGLEVILSQDRRLPLVAVNLWYHVGPANEEPGRTGFAHLFEHMMFQGSKHVPPDAHFKLLEAAGASEINGTTDFDRTNYFQTVPANQLPLALWLEADRMGFLLEKIDQSMLSNQQDVVRNERRQWLENQPYGLVSERLMHTLFPKGHPYYASVIGSHVDLASAKLEDVRSFFRQFYAPNNASLAIVGDFDTAEAKTLVEKYFGPLRRGPDVPKPSVETPPITSERRVTMTDAVELPKVHMAWLTPPIFKPGDAEAMVTAELLGQGRSSRLYKRLVYEKQLAQSVSAKQNSLMLASFFEIEAIARPGHTVEELEAAIDEELNALVREGPTPEEVERARNSIESGIVRGLERLGGFGGVADRLNMYNHYLGDPGYLPQDIARIRRVTPEAVRSFAGEYLRKSARVVVHALPGKKELPPDPPAEQAAPAESTTLEGINESEPWRAEPPAPLASRPLKLPVPTKLELPNGLTILLVEQHDLPVVSANVVVATGTGANPPDLPGLAGFTAAMLDEGTKTRSALEIADEAARLGAVVATGTWVDASFVQVRSLKKTFAESLALAADLVINPAFPAEELERQRKSRLAALVQERENPMAVAQRVTAAVLYGPAHPYGYSELGTEASIKKIDREALASFWKRHFVPNNAALVVAGDITAGELKTLAERIFGRWEKGASPQVKLPPPAPTRARLVIVDRPGSPQTELRVAKIGIARDAPDYFPVQVANTIMGGVFSSRLNMNLREDKGYTYGAASTFAAYRTAGPFLARAGVRTDVTAESIREMLKEIRRMSEAPPTDEELAVAKDFLVRSLPGEFETTGTIADNFQAVFVYDLGLDYFARYPERVARVTASEVLEAARRHLQPDELVVVAVGDKSAILPAIEKLDLQFGPPEFRTPEGLVVNPSSAALSPALSGADAIVF